MHESNIAVIDTEKTIIGNHRDCGVPNRQREGLHAAFSLHVRSYYLPPYLNR
jgi:hypothetical protein